jgi:methylglutaconyl-CoA hydratase
VSGREPVVLYAVTDGIARLTLNRPDKRNALDAETMKAILDGLERADSDASVRVVAIQGAGPDFSAGLDLAALRRLVEAPVLENLEDAERLAAIILRIRSARKVVVALVRGRALAGGCGLATACDLVLASEGALFGYTEVRIGFVPAMVMAILRRNTSEKRAFELVATGEIRGAEEMERIGLVNRIFPEDAFEMETTKYLRALADRSGSALWLTKRLFNHQDGLTFDAAIHAGVDINVLARMTDDTRAGVIRFLDERASRK